jgi:hypothetical protein
VEGLLYTPDSPRMSVIHPPARVGRSKIYNSMISIESGGPSRARAIERPIMRRRVHEEGGQ